MEKTANTKTKQIITSEDVHLYYGSFEALHGIDLNFGEHEIAALIGLPGVASQLIYVA